MYSLTLFPFGQRVGPARSKKGGGRGTYKRVNHPTLIKKMGCNSGCLYSVQLPFPTCSGLEPFSVNLVDSRKLEHFIWGLLSDYSVVSDAWTSARMIPFLE